jgi:hypothetical protein
VYTTTHGLSRRLTIVGASAALALLIGPAANATPPGDVPLGDFTCTDGSHISPVAKDLPGFMHSKVGFVGGQAIAPRWFSDEEQGTVTITKGAYMGDTMSFAGSSSGPANGARVTQPDLGDLTRCATGSVADSFSITIDQEALAITGIDSKYLGATADVFAVREFSVYLQPQQLAHR